MLSIGLTGGYATGKSTVARILRSLGAAVIDADELSHAVIRRGEPGWRQVVRKFGQEVLGPDGEIDRVALGRLVFARPRLRVELEKIVHPKVIAAMRTAQARARGEGVEVFIFEAPLLFEAGLAGEFDRVWVVSASPSRQMERAMARDGLSAEDVRARIAARMPLAEKEFRADLVLRNEGNLAELRRQVGAVWRALKTPHGKFNP